jgi:uncharacterized repeat protein (TIGR04076 family)
LAVSKEFPGGEKVKVSESQWKLMQEHLGYTDKEMRLFKRNPRNKDVLSKAAALMNTTIIAEVVESNGCNSHHKIGDKFYFDGAGNLISKLCPKRICIYALAAVAPLVFTSNELFYAGVDPNEMRFKRAGCFDVGVHCGGWGHIVLELHVEEHKKM